ncbi:PAS domain S-box protein [Thermodesulfobacteriota bacterium B35]
MPRSSENMPFHLKDVVDIDALTDILKRFHRLSNIPTAIIDPGGNFLTSVGWQRICLDFHLAEPASRKKCISNDHALQQECHRRRGCVLRPCPHGLVNTASPVIIDGRHVASIFTGQLFTEPLTTEARNRFRRQAERLGFDPDSYLQALAEVPVVDEERLWDNLAFLVRLVVSMGESGLAGLRLDRKQQALAESEERYRALFHNNHTVMAIIDPETGAIVDVNSKACEYYGYSRKELQGMTVADINLLPADEMARLIRRAGTVSSRPFQIRHRLATGEIRDVEIYSGPIRLHGRDLLYSIIHDITPRKRLDRALRRSRDQWEKTFDAIDDIVTLQDPNMCIVRANLAASRTFGVSPPELIGRHCYELFRGNSAPCEGCPVFSALGDRRKHTALITREQTGRIYTVSCSPLLDEQGNLEYLVHTATDITETIQLKEDRMRLAAAIEQASESVVITDVDGTIQYVNPAFEEHTGYSREEAVGENPRILKSGHHNAAFYKKMWDTISRGQVWMGHIINRKKDGTIFEEDASISPVRDSGGRITNYVAVKRDVTREVSLERQLHQAMKMEAIGTLAGGIAHDFNNILSAILGYGQMARQQLPPDHPVRDDLERILVAGQRAADLVRQILTFSRQDKEQMKPVRIQFIIKEVIKLLRASLPSTITIRQDIDTGCDPVLADPAKIHQVLMNLCTNAKYAMDGRDGVLTISLHAIEVDAGRHPECPQLEPGPYVDLMVADTGCGMDSSIREKIFDPFFTTRERGQGTGLGLAVVHGIVKKSGGEITVASEVGQGTVFHIYLPVIRESRGEMRRQQSDIPGGTERILVIDDDREIADLERRMLTGLGYRPTMFIDSTKALAAWKDDPDAYDLVLTDMTMPGISGAELARQILDRRPGTPIILCTGFSEAMDEGRAAELGIRGYIMKPVLLRELAARVREALDQA